VNKLALQNEAAEMRKRLDEIGRLLEGNEYPDGTPGWFWDSDETRKDFGYLKNGEPGHYGGIFGAYRLRRYFDPELSECSEAYVNFEPLKEAILPVWIEHDGGECPGYGDDLVIVEYRERDKYGEYTACGPASSRDWPRVKRYQVIRRAK